MKNFCFAPFRQLQVGSNGETGPCPYTAGVWKIKGKTVQERWQSKELEEFRDSFIKDEKNPICSRCWREESAGKTSLRNRLNNWGIQSHSRNIKNEQEIQNKILKKFIDSKSYQNYPRVLTIIPGNECNLSCVTCSGKFSSRWNALIKNNTLDRPEFIKDSKNWNLSDDEYADIVDNSEKLKRIELFGGEPFYNKRNRTLLIEKIIEKGTAKDITLYFNTNGTHFDEKYIEKLSRNFKELDITFSVDGVGEQFNYIRYGANFFDVMKNIECYSKFENVKVGIICTMSIFNILDISKYDDFFNNLFFRSVKISKFYNMVSYPSYLQPYQIPDNVKHKINLATKFKDNEKYIKNQNCDYGEWNKFRQYVRWLDKSRGTDFKTVFPALYELTKEHWN